MPTGGRFPTLAVVGMARRQTEGVVPMRSLRWICVVCVAASSGAWAKDAPTFHTREQVERARALCETEPWAAKQREDAVAAAARWVDMDDESLWDFVLDADVPRALNVRFGSGCPEHGEEVFRKGGALSLDHEH